MPELTDIRAYAALNTDNEPRFLCRLSNNVILLDGLLGVATLDGDSSGVFFIPHRPNQSPQSWMYVAAAEDYQKLSAPSPAVTAYKAGIQEPQSPPDTSPNFFDAAFFSDHDGTVWTSGGNAGSNTEGTRVSDTITDVMLDPASTSRYSVQVSAGKYYQVGQKVIVGNASDFQALIIDIIPETNPATRIEIESIYYFSGSTGRCVVTPQQTPINPAVPTNALNIPLAGTIFGQSTLASLRRGALVQLEYETVMVLSVTLGPTGQLSFECETTGTNVPGDFILGLPTLIIDHPSMSTGEIGQAIKSYSTDATLTGAGTGTLSAPLSNNPFSTNQGQQAQLDDYLSFSVNVSVLSNLVIGRIIFNVGPTVDYVTDVYYAEFTAADIAKPLPNLSVSAAAANAATVPTFNEFLQQQVALIPSQFRAFQLSSPAYVAAVQAKYDQLYGNQTPATTGDTVLYPADQWAVIQLPIRALQRTGNDQSRTLANTNGVQLQFQTTATTGVKISSLWVGGGGQPDVGRIGSPYLYRVRGRSTLTGALSNPSPSTRYGTYNRRQSTHVSITDLVGDAQQDTWDIFRYGGTVTSWRYVGSMPCTGLNNTDTFTDNLFDTALLLNPALDFDNFEPWPSVGLPITSLAGSGTVDGTVLDITFTTTADVPAEILRWLPGTLLVVNNNAYTLYTRPTHITGNRYVLETVESMGAATLITLVVQEPLVANQHLPYVFGPDSNGTVFAVGDPLRPGTLSFSKSNNPDSVPDTYNLEISAPSEPLLGGIVMNGLAYVASTKRWWALYPSFDNTLQRYQKVERAIPRGLAWPYGLCTDGSRCFYGTVDGIWMHDGNSGQSLTDADLRNLFPHEGVNGTDQTYAAIVTYAPDYSRVQTFRLHYYKGYLYADYATSTDLRRTLVLDLLRKRPAWSVDHYADPIRVHYGLEGPEQTLAFDTFTQYNRLLLGDTAGRVYVQQDLTNDNGTPITAAVATFEWNGGDIRADQFWGDAFIDCDTPAGLEVSPIYNKVAQAGATIIPVTITRAQNVVNAAGLQTKALGLLARWTDDYDTITRATQLFSWQPLYQAVPIEVYSWKTQSTSFGFIGYFHIRQVVASYISTADVTLTLTFYDGNSPATITLPSTGGEQQKIIFPVSFNKGLLVSFEGMSTEPWQPFFDSWETHAGQWGRTDAYRVLTDVEAPKGIGRGIDG